MGEKIGEGIGNTRRDAQRHAAEGSIKNLASMESFFLLLLLCAYNIYFGITPYLILLSVAI